MTRKSLIPRPAAGVAALLLAAGLLHAGARADSVVYKCVDQNGRVELTDVRKSGCKSLDLPGYVAAPASAPRPNSAVTLPASPARAPAAAPSNFPRVDNATQRARDDDRREILNDELRNEEKKLADLKRDFNGGEPERQGSEKNYQKYLDRVAQMRDDIGRTEKNIEALKREIANTR